MNENKDNNIETNKSDDNNIIDASHVAPDESGSTPPTYSETETAKAAAPSGMTEPGPEQTTESAGNNKIMTYAIVVVIIAVVLGAIFWFMGQGERSFAPNSQQAAVGAAYPDVVAVVNGEEVPKEELVESVINVQQQAQGQGMDVTTEGVQQMVQEQALTGLINTKLLIQAAEEAGVTVSEAQVDSELAQIEAQLGGEAALEARMNELGLEIADVRQDIAEQLLIDQYLTTETDAATVTVPEEEVRAFYDQLAANGQELPSFEELAPQIEAQLNAQGQQEIVANLIEELRTAAEIEIFVDESTSS